jgi:hypothetical protein
VQRVGGEEGRGGREGEGECGCYAACVVECVVDLPEQQALREIAAMMQPAGEQPV